MKYFAIAPSLLMLVGSGCSGPAVQKPPTVETKVNTPPTPSATTSVAEPGTFSLTALYAPEKYEIDGNVTEWGSLLPLVAPPKSKKEKGKATKAKDEEQTPPEKVPSPRDAETHVGFAIASNEAVFVAEVGETAWRDGFVVAVMFQASDVPNIGEWGRGGAVWPFECEYEHNDIVDGDWVRGARNPPEVIAACEQLNEDHLAFVIKNSERFERFYKIGREGILALVNGEWKRVEGAKLAHAPNGKGATVEVSMPFLALPRVSEAPLEKVKMAAFVEAPASRNDVPAEAWSEHELPRRVHFDNYGELRAKAFEAGVIDPTVPPGLSFQPGDPIHVEALSHLGDPGSVTPVQKTIYEKFTMLGDVEIGHVPSDGLSVATFKGGNFVDFLPIETDYNFSRTMHAHGMADRDGEKHIFMFYPKDYSASQGIIPPHWVVMAIAPDGTIRDAAAACELPDVNWEKEWEFISEDTASFGFRGPVYARGAGRGKKAKQAGAEVLYTWDSKKKAYSCTTNEIVDPKPPAANQAKPGEAEEDLDGLMKRPTEWEGLREITVTGSSALTCVTQTIGPKNGAWFRAHCTGDPVLEATPIRGHRKTQTSIALAAGKAEIFTPIAEGLEVSFKLKFEKAGPRKMTIRWKKGTPTPSGVIEK